MKKIIVSFMLVISMVLSPIQVIAQTNSNKQYREGHSQLINKDIPYFYGEKSLTVPTYNSSAKHTCSSIDELIKIAKDYCEKREENFTIKYTGKSNELNGVLHALNEYIESVDDYLARSMGEYDVIYRGLDGNINISFTVSYTTTKSEEEFVDFKIDNILHEIIKPNMTDDQKEKAIHDYIVLNVEYDKALNKHTAYNALHDRTCVCQGYAMLTYKMLNKVGIKTKIVVGKGNGGSHAWNLVNLHGKWYQLDCTWDDPIPDEKGRVLYNYYNLTDDEIGKNHTWDRSKYPVANIKYDMNDINKPQQDIPEIPEEIPQEKIIDLTGFKKMKSKANISQNKVWNIDFTKIVNTSSINKNNVFVVEENEFKNKFNNIEELDNPEFIKSLNKVSTNINYNNDKKTLVIKPQQNYESNKSYYIVITKNVLSSYGENIPKPVIMEFTIK